MHDAYCALFYINYEGVVDDKAEREPGPCDTLSLLINEDLQSQEKEISGCVSAYGLQA